MAEEKRNQPANVVPIQRFPSAPGLFMPGFEPASKENFSLSGGITLQRAENFTWGMEGKERAATAHSVSCFPFCDPGRQDLSLL
jgi:hypothetical protein